LSFAVGAVIPLLVAGLSPEKWLLAMVAATSLVCLAVLGRVAARIARVIQGALRVMFWGVLAMGITAGVGMVFGTKA
jgi:VIT1/CCC1 family predicted Fe2+/Mn2+ transporter